MKGRRSSLLIAVALASVFLSGCKVSYSVEVDAPLTLLWEYASDNKNAHDWSIFFDHFVTQPGHPPSGVGALRRCFRNADEHGMYWDERVVKQDLFKSRQIRTHNIHGFQDPLLNKVEYNVYQTYESLPGGRSRLTFASEISASGGLMNALRGILRGHPADKDEVVRVFKYNLENIAAATEALYRGSVYVRPHPYETTSYWPLEESYDSGLATF